MKLHPFSDLHIPHHIKAGKNPRYRLMHSKAFLDDFILDLPTDADAYVIAGDFYDNALYKGVKFLRILLTHFGLSKPDKHIFFVPGNHEFYKTSQDGVFANEYDLPENVHWLHRDRIEINGVIFAGSTLWFPKNVMTDTYKRRMNDFTYIYDFESWVYDENNYDQNFFKESIKTRNGKSLVCISHHLPCSSCLPYEYINDELNIFYVGSNDMHHYLGEPGITWIHGHNHTPVDKMLGDTRVISNPYGYYKSTPYNNKLIIEV